MKYKNEDCLVFFPIEISETLVTLSKLKYDHLRLKKKKKRTKIILKKFGNVQVV